MTKERVGRALQLLVMFSFVLTAALFSVSFVAEQSLSPESRHESATQPWWAMGGMFLGLVGTITGAFAMLLNKRWGRWVHLVTNVTWVVSGAFAEAQAVPPATSTLYALLLIVSGVIYGLAFFTDAMSPRVKDFA